MERIKKLPFMVKGIIVVITAAVLVFAAALGLRVLEEKQQKPRVIKALAELVSEAAEDKYSMEGFFHLLDSGKLTHTGDITVTDIDEALIPKQYRFMTPYLRHASLEFTVNKDDLNRQADFQAEAVLKENMTVRADGYLDDTACTVRVPDFHERYLTFSPDNLKKQYEASLLYSVFGDSLSLPEQNLADYVFTGAESEVSEEKEALSMSFSDCLELARTMYEKITVSKTEKKEDILWNGNYESCTAYEMIVPTEIFNQFFRDTVWERSGHTVVLEEEELPMLIYLSSSKRLLKLELEANVFVDGTRVPSELVFYPKGVENAWDSVLLELEITWDDIIYGIDLVCSNEFSDMERILHTKVSLTQPYITELVDMDIRYEPKTGAAEIDFVCKTPMLSMDGFYGIEPLSDAIEKPQDAVAVFDMNLFDILKFTNEINWSFFKKQE
ncbi:MAG: hypothetical protein J6B06_00210 [Lachnospiraceae bacterium]|nr:hypothetical protein [Lachnospiraceae bacterium]